MPEEASNEEKASENCTILQGPDGAMYCISDASLQAHRLPDDVASAVSETYLAHAEVSGFGFDPTKSSFQILGQGPVVRRVSQTVPTMDGWFDMFASGQPGTTPQR